MDLLAKTSLVWPRDIDKQLACNWSAHVRLSQSINHTTKKNMEYKTPIP